MRIGVDDYLDIVTDMIQYAKDHSIASGWHCDANKDDTEITKCAKKTEKIGGWKLTITMLKLNRGDWMYPDALSGKLILNKHPNCLG